MIKKTLLVIFLFLATQSKAQVVFRDSVLQKYVYNGAHRFPIFSHAWGVYLDSALKILPQDAYLWEQRAMPYFKQMKYEVGMIYLDSAVKYNAKKHLDYRAFVKCIFLKNYSASLFDFEEAKRLNGNMGIMDHPYDFYIGLCHLQLIHFDSAKYYFELCVKSDEKRGDSWVHYLRDFYLGVAHYETGDYKKAIEHFDRALTNYSHFSDAKFYKALCLANKSQFNEAIALMREADKDLAGGATINEDNSKYEKYPYQIDKDLLKFYIERIQNNIK